MKNKIYIIGPVCSGKTTLSNNISSKLGIRAYELDKVIWDDDNGNVRRSQDDINSLFKKIVNNNKWIIEDIGREEFIEGLKEADIVYYLDISPFVLYKRCVFRWIKQKIGIESYNYKPTIKSLFENFGWIKRDVNNKKVKLNYIRKYSRKYVILNKKNIKDIFN